MIDNVNHPAHYTTGGIECIDAIEAATEGLTGIEAVCTANAIKYLWRWKRKNGAEDLRKAVWYINRLLDEQAPKKPAKACREWLKENNPDCISPKYAGGCFGCPHDDLYGDQPLAEQPDWCQGMSDEQLCRACWDRPIGDDGHGTPTGHSDRPEPENKKMEE